MKGKKETGVLDKYIRCIGKLLERLDVYVVSHTLLKGNQIADKMENM